MAEAANSGGTSSVHDAQEYKPLEKTVPGLTILIDNYDSFTFNIVQYLCRLGTEVHVRPIAASYNAESVSSLVKHRCIGMTK